jgi:hypothetical protein
MRTAALIAFLLALQSAPEIPKEKFDSLHALIKPQGNEFAWYEEIPWLTSVQEAREKAAKEDKPIVVWCSADGQPCGAT